MNCHHILTLVFILSTMALGRVTSQAAETAEEAGLRIIRELDRRDSGWVDFRCEMNMVLRDASGREHSRTMRSLGREVPGDGDQSLIVFSSPAEVSGTVLLTYGHKKKRDDQWLFLPAIKRTKRISSGNRSGPFVGSEFAFEDLTGQEIEKFTHRFLGEGKANGMACFILERTPVDRKSGYSKQVSWIDKKEYRWQKTEFYDRKKSLLKTLTLTEYRKHLGRYWRADRARMLNHQTGKSTDLIAGRWQFKQGLSPQQFKPSRLEKVR
ncbi:MAG: outer membrane lipoprotein-sorting protein [Verrucomicrobiota bacterium]